jgi:hypothetical protein
LGIAGQLLPAGREKTIGADRQIECLLR